MIEDSKQFLSSSEVLPHALQLRERMGESADPRLTPYKVALNIFIAEMETGKGQVSRLILKEIATLRREVEAILPGEESLSAEERA